MTGIDSVLRHCDASHDRHLDQLFTLLRQPSISTQGIGVTECAELVRALLASSGFVATVYPTPGWPVVYGERIVDPALPTVLVYGHYDVQPPEPYEAWDSPPFEPTIRDGRIYCRGVCDNKGQFVANILGAAAWIEATGELPVNVKFIIDGEEESGSPSFEPFVREHADLLRADLVYGSDGHVHDADQPIAQYGCRGLIYLELVARGPNRDLHSGNFGGVAPNPAWKLVHLLSTMFSPEGEILVPGVLDGVRPVDPAMRAALDAIPIDEAAALAGIGLKEKAPPRDVPFYDRLMVRPTMNIAGFHSGYGGEGTKTVLPAEARVKMDLRLVPDQDPRAVYEAIRDHIARVAPDVEVSNDHTFTQPSRTPLDHPFAEAVRRAVTTGFGKRPVDVPSTGASGPYAVWPTLVGADIIGVPYGTPDQANHAPNENMLIDRYFAGIRTSAALLGEMAARGRG